MLTAQDQNGQQKPKQWSYKDPHRYPVPKGNEDPWETLLEPLLANDKVQCDAWKEEVQNLLIFAGLFSAVVTSFVVESSKALQPDPNTLLLSHIATLIGNATHDTIGNVAPQIQTSPSPSAYRINALWFSSLVLSLTTVLVGIVSLQWIREHQQYSGLSSQEKFSIFCMRKEALKAWYVPQFFAGLPLLLQGALALYLAGLVDHLLEFGRGVAIPGVIFIALSLFFLVATTILPTIQGLVILPIYLEISIDLPSPCPYKSPQSQAFRRLATTFQWGFLATSRVLARIQWLVMHLRKFLYSFFRLESSQPRFIKTSHEFPSILNVWCKASWIDFDWSWLRFHDCMLLNIMDDDVLPKDYRPTQPLYDAIKGIRSVSRENRMNTSEPYLFAQFHCLRDISSSFIGVDHNMTLQQYYQYSYFQRLLILKDSHHLDQRSCLLSEKLDSRMNSHFLSEESTLAIINMIDPYHQYSSTLSRHFAECNLRILTVIYSKVRPLHQESENRKSLHLAISPSSLDYAMWSIRNNTEFIHQWALSVKCFFSAIINSSPDDPQLDQSFHAHPFFYEYLDGFIPHICSISDDDFLGSETLTIIVSTVTEISAALNDPPSSKQDCLFYTASKYAKLLAMEILLCRNPRIVAAACRLLESLNTYKAYRGNGVPSWEKILGIPCFSNKEWWEFLKLPGAMPESPSLYRSNLEEVGANLSSLSLTTRSLSKAGDDASTDVPIYCVPPFPQAEGNEK